MKWLGYYNFFNYITYFSLSNKLDLFDKIWSSLLCYLDSSV